ncbi:zona pellucida sperm-binding protein 3 [Brachionichthys hirsutus]|uniref:zona pellucida sperm-binding protein 3 n=1 Tax=Brachionichthys hirsutus TaxID=412623 RepID=UPI003604D10C
MTLMHVCFLFLLFCLAHGFHSKRGAGPGLFVRKPVVEWKRMETLIGEEMKEDPLPKSRVWRSGPSGGSSKPEARIVPEYVTVSASDDHREAFKPERGARPLPDTIREMLLGTNITPTVTEKPTTGNGVVEILCHIDRMYVRIRRKIFQTREAYKYLKLGSCPVNQGSKEHYYLLYLLTTDCSFTQQSNIDDVLIGNVLHYDPPGPVLRELSFNIPLQCKFPRYFHSFKVGFRPMLQGGTVFKALQAITSFILAPQDASGNEISSDQSYTLGQAMYFEAKQPNGTTTSGDQRLYIDKCFMTASLNPGSAPKYTVIDKRGCMIDAEVTDQSKFHDGPSKMIQKFSVGSFVFKDRASISALPQQLYMHCEMSVGDVTPTQSSKACNYDLETQMWKELYGDSSVCTCCESTCSSAQPKASRNIISSPSWKVDLRST